MLKRNYSYITLTFVAALPLLLCAIPMEWLKEQHTICLFKNLTGSDCIGCGITRAVISAVQCDFAAAFQYNKLIVIVFPLLVYAWIKLVLTNIKKLRPTHIRVHI